MKTISVCYSPDYCGCDTCTISLLTNNLKHLEKKMSHPKKTIYIFFGEMGAGKNYYASQFAETLVFKKGEETADFFDGDSVCTPEIVERVKNFQPLSRELVKDYVQVLADSIERKMDECTNLVVAQALYFNADREFLATYLKRLGYDVKAMYWVRPPLFRHLRNLWSRPNGLKWIKYWWDNRKRFEEPNAYLKQWFYCWEIETGDSKVERWLLGLDSFPYGEVY